jgi:hypothetical protein
MPTTIPTTTSLTRPVSPSTGDAYFETDTNDFIIYDGANWRGYNSDGIPFNLGTSTHSLSLDGTDDRMECGDVSAINSVSAFSVTAWFRTNTSATMYILSGVGSAGGFYDGFQVYLSSGNPHLAVGNGASGYDGAKNTSANLIDDTWHHVAAIMDGSTYTVYVDGSSTGSTDIGNGPTITTTTATNGDDFKIGARFDDNNTFAFAGYVDDVAVFNRALTSTELSDIYNSKRYFSPSSLWALDNSTNDLAGSNNGTLINDAQFVTSTKRP